MIVASVPHSSSIERMATSSDARPHDRSDGSSFVSVSETARASWTAPFGEARLCRNEAVRQPPISGHRPVGSAPREDGLERPWPRPRLTVPMRLGPGEIFVPGWGLHDRQEPEV
jgi:hypothetical protein